MPANRLVDIINDQDTNADLIMRMQLNKKYEIVVACSDGNAIFYQLNESKGVFEELIRVKADFTEPDAPCLVNILFLMDNLYKGNNSFLI